MVKRPKRPWGSSGRPAEDVAQFALDYTFWLDLLFVAVGAGLVVVAVRYRRKKQEHRDGVKMKPRSWIALAFTAVVLAGLTVFAFTATG